jgi:hypothetical protein
LVAFVDLMPRRKKRAMESGWNQKDAFASGNCPATARWLFFNGLALPDPFTLTQLNKDYIGQQPCNSVQANLKHRPAATNSHRAIPDDNRTCSCRDERFRSKASLSQ